MTKRDHGGNLDWAVQRFGGDLADWIDLSTGINRCPYPLPPMTQSAWTRLPTATAIADLCAAARSTYGTGSAVLPVAGGQAAIQLFPRLTQPGRVAILCPTYNEHAEAFRSGGWQVSEVSRLEDLRGADMAVVVNPNNPDGRSLAPGELIELKRHVGRLIVDESFMDPTPELSLAPDAGADGLIVLRSFGKFYGLAGLRLGFVLASGPDVDRLKELAGPWQVSGPAIEVGLAALADSEWHNETSAMLARHAGRLDALAASAGWLLVGGTFLFRLYQTPSAEEVQAHLAENCIWSRTFPWSKTWVRLGIPGAEEEWHRLAAALEG